MDAVSPKRWSIAQRQSFRFFSVYFILYMYITYIEELWDPIVLKAGQWLHIWKEITVMPNGSGDTTYNYIQLLCMLVMAVVISLIWWAIDYKRKSYNTAQYWVMAMLRYALAYQMITYGSFKIIKLQFPDPSFTRLLEPYGDSSPMGLAWTFMGYSKAFNLFTGWAEAIGGILLLFRRTTMFGCLFSMTVLTNIVAMNFCFDIPVKLFSTHLLLVAIYICSPYFPILVNFFVRHKPVTDYPRMSVYRTRKQRIAHVIIKLLILLTLAYRTVAGTIDAMEYSSQAVTLSGLYEADTFITDNDTLQPLITDTVRWRYFNIEWEGYARVHYMDGSKSTFETTTDTAKQTITLKTKDDVSTLYKYSKSDSTHLNLDGIYNGVHVKILMHRKQMKDFTLVKTGFNWINEYPNNK